MKARPRRIEREVARILSDLLVPLGMTPVERVPILGRTGPDIEINELGLVIDVKSRQSVPKGMITEKDRVLVCPGQWYACRLNQLRKLVELNKVYAAKKIDISTNFTSVQNWLDHMDKWTGTEYPAHYVSAPKQGITSLVLHRPGMDIKSSTLVIQFSHLEVLHERLFPKFVPNN